MPRLRRLWLHIGEGLKVKYIFEFFALLHFERQHLSVAYAMREVERSKRHLELALDALERARADVIAEQPIPRKLPSFLMVNSSPPRSTAE